MHSSSSSPMERDYFLIQRYGFNTLEKDLFNIVDFCPPSTCIKKPHSYAPDTAKRLCLFNR